MKRKNLRSKLASLVVFLLVGVMGVTSAIMAFNTKNTASPIVATGSAITAGHSDRDISSLLDPDKLMDIPVIGKQDKVSFIVEVGDTALIDMYLEDSKGYATFADYRVSPEGMDAAEALINKQKAVYNKIARQADVKLTYNYVNVMNGFAMEITYGDREVIDKIAAKANIVNTMVGERYDAPNTQDAVAAVKNQVSALETGIFDSGVSIEDGFAGQGMVAGILDTGLDFEHIAFDPLDPNFELDKQLEEGTLKFTKEDIEEAVNDTNRFGMSALTAGRLVNGLTVDDVYRNEKVPFAFDYSDNDPMVSSGVEQAHGTHVGGIIAGHSDTPRKVKEGVTKGGAQAGDIYLREVTYKKDSEGNNVEDKVRYYQREEDKEGAHDYKRVYNDALTDEDLEDIIDEKTKKQITGIKGVAPQAQLAIFKVFSDNLDKGAESSFLLAALEDCITLGVDAINMSLGSDCGFQDETDARDSIFHVYRRIEGTGISLVVAGANSYSSSFNSHYGLNLTSNPDSGTLGSPAAYDASFTVASISGVESQYLLATDANGKEYGAAYYSEATTMGGQYCDFMADIYSAVEKLDDSVKSKMIQPDGTLKIEYVTIPGLGEQSDFSGISTRNKIALVKRGEINFEDKVKNARDTGALACIVYNNAAGNLHMQLGDTVIGYPACSITMDAASKIKDMDKAGKAYFVIDKENKAGPFISDFSSWGPLPNLVLKPEITAHGGEIYSAIPGDETSYSRFSGTSMACPNTAGVVLILRQYMQNPANNYQTAKEFGVWDNEKNAIDYNLLERRINQLLMSTATIAHNEQDNPYSPRKQGAGLADLERSRASKQYLYVTGVDEDGNEYEKERTKIELFDDPQRTGEYEMTFYAMNVDRNKEAKYKLHSYVMTEGVSTDGKTVNEMSHVFKLDQEYSQVIKIGDTVINANDVITVPAGESVKITYSISLGDSAKEWLKQFVNGMYVDGFVCLENVEENGIDLNVPYLAFYGDWSDAPILDYDVYETSKDENDDTIPDDDKRYAGSRPLTLIGKLIQDTAEYSLGLGQFPFTIPKELEGETPDATADKCAISFNTDSGMCGLFGVGGYLRPAKKLFWVLTDALTGEVIKEGMYGNAKKASSTGGYGGAFLELDIGTLDVRNNVRYNMTIYPVLDWHDERYSFYKTDENGKVVKDELGRPVYDVQANIKKIIADNEEYNEAHKDSPRRYYWSSDFWVDTDAPYISNAEVNIVRNSQDQATYLLNLDVTDNHYAMALSMNYFSKIDNKFVTVFSEDGMRPFNGERNATTRMQFDITKYWDQIRDGLLYRKTHTTQEVEANPELGKYLTQFQVEIFDYAFNKCYYDIDLYDIMDNLSGAMFGEIGNYTSYTNGEGETVNLMISYNNEVATDNNGNPREMESFTIVEGQSVNLMKSIVTTPKTAWREDFLFEVSDPSVLQFDDEKGELYAISGGEATVTLKSRTNEGVSAQVTVKVLSEEEARAYNINVERIQSSKTLNAISFTESGKTFNAGEKYTIEFELDPWYIDLDLSKYEVKWSVSNPNAATVEKVVDPDDPKAKYKAVVTADDGKYVNGEYVKNFSVLPNSGEYPVNIYVEIFEKRENGSIAELPSYAASFPFYVLEEFEVQGNQLKAYHGTPDDFGDDGKPVEGRVVIPDNLNIYTIAGNLFHRRDDITEIKFPHNLTTIGYASCAYMTNLRKVEFPDTLEKIDGYAFAAYTVPGSTGPDTKLYDVDFTKCTKPIQVEPYAFAMQRYIDVDLPNSKIVDYGDDVNKLNRIKLLENSKFDLKNVRVVGQFSFYGLNFVQEADFTGLRSADNAAFFGMGSGLIKYGLGDGYAKAIFGEYTTAGLGAFVGVGFGDIELNMRRISQQLFFGETVESESDDPQDDGLDPLYTGAIKNVTFTADNVVLEQYAFMYSSVENVTFKGSVKYIGEAAFAYSKLKSVTFEKTCEEIYNQAFLDTELTEFKFPAGLKKISNGLLFECKELEKVTIDKDCLVDDLGIRPLSAFEDAKALPSTFSGCEKLAAIEVEEGNANFASKDGVLYSADYSKIIAVPCSKVTEDGTELLDGVKEIGSGAFASNSSIKSINLTGIKKIGSGAFMSCGSLESVVIPSTTEEIPAEAFYGCVKLTDVDLSAATSLERIGDFAFMANAFESIELPSSVNKIGKYAFAENEALKSFEMPQPSVTRIEEGTFAFCTSLEMVRGCIWIEYVGVRAFFGSAIKSINLNRCREIDEMAFAMCEKLTTVSMSNKPVLEKIGELAFAYLPEEEDADGAPISKASLETINLSSVKEIGDNAFYFQNKLKNVNLQSCEIIGSRAFFYCQALESIGTSLESLRRIESNAFTRTKLSLQTPAGYFVSLPATIEYIDSSAFADAQVVRFEISSENKNYFTDNGVIYKYLYDVDDYSISDEDKAYELVSYPNYNDRAMEYTILDGTVRIAPYAFYTTDSLVRVNIPASVRTIGNAAFYGSSVKVYNFVTLEAPELEALTSTITTEFSDVYFWQVYDNFYAPFTFSNNGSGYKYNPIRITMRDDVLVQSDNIINDRYQYGGQLQNLSYLGGGLLNFYYGIMICRPANAEGFDNLIWTNYFDSELVTSELIEDATIGVMDLIRALPEANNVTLDDRAQIESARNRFNGLRSDEQRAFVRKEGLVETLEACESKLTSLTNNATRAIESVKALIDELPVPSKLTLDNESSVAEARRAYDALSDSNRDLFNTTYKSAYDKLTECEAKIEALKNGDNGDGKKEGCGSCGTVAFGNNGGGTGLMIGLGVVMLACLALVLLRKRPSKQK